MKRYFLLLCCIFLAPAVTAEVTRAQLTSQVQDKEPVNDLGRLVIGEPGQVTTVFFFSQIQNLADQTVSHVWLLDDVEQARVELDIGSMNWRTFSSKRLHAPTQGEWIIQIWHGQKLLYEHQFDYRLTR